MEDLVLSDADRCLVDILRNLSWYPIIHSNMPIGGGSCRFPILQAFWQSALLLIPAYDWGSNLGHLGQRRIKITQILSWISLLRIYILLRCTCHAEISSPVRNYRCLMKLNWPCFHAIEIRISGAKDPCLGELYYPMVNPVSSVHAHFRHHFRWGSPILLAAIQGVRNGGGGGSHKCICNVSSAAHKEEVIAFDSRPNVTRFHQKPPRRPEYRYAGKLLVQPSLWFTLALYWTAGRATWMELRYCNSHLCP